MAGLRSKTALPVGSAPWIANERSQALQFVQQEVEDFSFAVRNEMDWLNEHMAEIFNNHPISIAEVFKTPGKLRGKTPRTVRKRNALESRAPLTDIFAPNQQAASAAQEQGPSKPAEHAAAGAKEPQPVCADAAPVKPHNKPSRPGKENIDSGYHGMSTEEESDADKAARASLSAPASEISQDLPKARDSQDTVPIIYPQVLMDVDDQPVADQANSMAEGRDERATTPEERNQDVRVPEATEFNDHGAAASAAQNTDAQSVVDSPARGPAVADAPRSVAHGIDRRSSLEPAQATAASSQRSSPAPPVVRKSSLSFAALPAREPLAPKLSIEHGVSHSTHWNATSLGLGRVGAVTDQLTAPRIQVGQTIEGMEAAAVGNRMDMDEDEKQTASAKESEDLTETRLHRKTSTQRLHERISQLGQSQASRPTKSIPSLLHPVSQPDPLELPSPVAPEPVSTANQKQNVARQQHVDEEDSWMPPRKAVAPPEKILSDAMSASSREPQAAMAPTAQQMDIDIPVATISQEEAIVERSHEIEAARIQRVSSPAVSSVPVAAATELSEERATSERRPVEAAGPPRPTDLGTMRPPAAAKPAPNSNADGPLTASKAKLSSILKSARGIFASSAGVSAQAKMETMSPATTMRLRSQTNDVPAAAVVQEVEMQDEAVVPDVGQEKALEEESQAPSQDPTRNAKGSKRPVRPAKAAASKAKPVPVAIKVGTASQRELDNRKVNPPNAALASNLQQSLAPPAAPPTKQPAASGKTSAASMRKVTPASNLRSASANSGRPRALAAAARKKEQDEQEAQRKLEAKREMERRKAALQEEERRKEQQRRDLEVLRQQEQRAQAEDAKKAAKRQEIERRRLENTRKQEQQRGLQMHTRARAGNEPQPVSQQEKAPVHMAAPRGELNSARTVSKMTTATNVRGLAEENGRSINHPPINPARPPKRGAPVEETDDRAPGPAARTGPAYVQIEAKRRHTNDEDEAAAARQAMPPPMRQSTLRKDVPNKAFLAQAYMNASSAPTSQLQGGGASTIKLTTPQHAPPMKASHALDINKFATAKIPFAEGHGHGHGHAGLSNATIAAATATATSAVASASALTALGKTPSGHGHGRPGAAAGAAAAAAAGKSSPQYRDGDAIELPEIPTDSEDSDDDDGRRDDDDDGDDGDGEGHGGRGNGFNVPDWAQSPALRSLLQAQQLVDPEQVFGPIAPLHMEEIFKNKDRHHRFRNRTSSANWSGQDRLTQDEIQRDLEARRRLIANGEWSYGLGLS